MGLLFFETPNFPATDFAQFECVMAVVLSVVPSLEMVRDFDGFIFRGGKRHHGVTDLHRLISALGRIIFRHERPPLPFLVRNVRDLFFSAGAPDEIRTTGRPASSVEAEAPTRVIFV